MVWLSTMWVMLEKDIAMQVGANRDAIESTTCVNERRSSQRPNGLPITRRERTLDFENPTDLAREAIGCMGLLGA